jgi:hypothetical protein
MQCLRHATRKNMKLKFTSIEPQAVRAAIVIWFSLLPSVCRAQSPVALGDTVKPGLKVVAMDTAGHEHKGRIKAVMPDGLRIEKIGGTEEQIRTEDLRFVREVDGNWNGALTGAAVGGGLGLWDYLRDTSEPGNGVFTAVSVLLGAAIGAGIDALIDGKVLYRRSSTGTGRIYLPTPFLAPAVGIRFDIRF